MRPWQIIVGSGLFGTGLWVTDDLLDGLAGNHILHHITDVMEFLILVPGMALVGWLIAQALAVRERRIEDERQERLIALGLVAASIAHEVRNPLQSLRLLVDELHAEGRLGEDHPRLRRQIQRIDQAVALVYRLTGPVVPGSCDAAQEVRTAVADEAQRQGRSVPVDLVITDIGVISVAADVLGLITTNLLRNALAAVGDGERVTVELDRRWLEIRNPGRLPDRLDLSTPRLSASANGLGLGLYIARQLAEAGGCRLSVRQCDATVIARLELPCVGS